MRILALTLLAATAARAGDDEQPLKLDRAIPLEDVRGRIDHLALSADGNILAVAAIGNGTVEIVDLAAGRVVHRIRGIGVPTAGAFLEDGQLVMASGQDGKLHFFDGRSYEPTKAVDVGEDADALRVDATRQYVGIADGALVFVENGRKTAEIPLAAHPEGFQPESKGPRILVNVPDAGHVAVLDREKREVVATWKLKDAKANYPMALDEERGRVLIGCRMPPRLLVLDATAGAVKASVGISGDVDDLFLDPKARRVYASCGEGFVDVIAQRDGDRYDRVASVPTSPGARTCLLDTKVGRLFVAAPSHGGRAAEIRVYRTAPAPPRD